MTPHTLTIGTIDRGDIPIGGNGICNTSIAYQLSHSANSNRIGNETQVFTAFP